MNLAAHAGLSRALSAATSFFRRRGVKLAIGLLLLGALYRAIDWRAAALALGGLDGRLLLGALALFVPQTLVSALRWRLLARAVRPLSFGAAVAHILRASAMNLLLPSKLGDLTKAAMLGPTTAGELATAGRLAIGEKIGDVAALSLALLCGASGTPWPVLAAFGAAVALAAVFAARYGDPRSISTQAAIIAGGSLVLWALHLGQIDLFLRAAGVRVAPELSLARLPMAIFAGLLPFTLWGVGTRDAALVWLFADVAPASTMAAVGLLTALRYLIPGAVGLVLHVAQRSESPPAEPTFSPASPASLTAVADVSARRPNRRPRPARAGW